MTIAVQSAAYDGHGAANKDDTGAKDVPRVKSALQALNFFSADQTGIGPFFGVFLAQHGWSTGLIGTVMTIGGVTGLFMTAPAGALVDHTARKRTYVILSGVFTIASSLAIWASQRFWVVAASQVAGAVAGAFIGPAMLGITLGVVRQRGFNLQNGRNQAYNHAGNVAGAAISGWFGFGSVFLLGIALGALSILCVLAIPRAAIDDRAARGMANEEGAKAHGLDVLVRSKPLLVLVACLVLFAIGNGCMLPLYGLAVTQAHKANPAAFAATTVVVAQSVMVFTALIAMKMIEKIGYWFVILLTFVALPIRGLLAACLITAWGVFPVQALDGIGAGLQGVAVSGLMTRLLEGTGRVNAGQGTVAMVVGVGGALSPLIGGWLAQSVGYPATFLTMGSLSLGSLALWIGFRPMLQEACAAAQD